MRSWWCRPQIWRYGRIRAFLIFEWIVDLTLRHMMRWWMAAEVWLALRFSRQRLLFALWLVAALHAFTLAHYFIKQGSIAARQRYSLLVSRNSCFSHGVVIESRWQSVGLGERTPWDVIKSCPSTLCKDLVFVCHRGGCDGILSWMLTSPWWVVDGRNLRSVAGHGPLAN